MTVESRATRKVSFHGNSVSQRVSFETLAEPALIASVTCVKCQNQNERRWRSTRPPFFSDARGLDRHPHPRPLLKPVESSGYFATSPILQPALAGAFFCSPSKADLSLGTYPKTSAAPPVIETDGQGFLLLSGFDFSSFLQSPFQRPIFSRARRVGKEACALAAVRASPSAEVQ